VKVGDLVKLSGFNCLAPGHAPRNSGHDFKGRVGILVGKVPLSETWHKHFGEHAWNVSFGTAVVPWLVQGMRVINENR